MSGVWFDTSRIRCPPVLRTGVSADEDGGMSTPDISADTIVVGVDGSPTSGVALDWAATEARYRRTHLLIVYGLHMPITTVPFGGSTALPPSDELRSYAMSVLTEAQRRVTENAPDTAVATTLALRQPSDAIVAAAEDAQLVVVGSRGLNAVQALALGSVSSRVAARSPCPVIVVPSVEPAPHDGTIVVGVDGSTHSDAALRFAFEEAARRSAKIVALNAYRTPVLTVPTDDPDELRTASAAQHRHAETVVNEAVERAVDSTGTQADVTVRVLAGHPDDALIEAAGEAALLVVGPRGRGGLRSLILGSVSRSVLHHARCPVAVVPARTD